MFTAPQLWAQLFALWPLGLPSISKLPCPARFYIILLVFCLTERSADAALPRANVGGNSAKNRSPARVWDGDAAPLTLSLGETDRAFSDFWI